MGLRKPVTTTAGYAVRDHEELSFRFANRAKPIRSRFVRRVFVLLTAPRFALSRFATREKIKL
jgi:hypothetical protein